jgi:flavodoxin I
MDKIGIFFGTDSGTTRLMAKKMARQLGDAASKPLNVNRITVDDMLQFDALILGTPTYGEGQLPGLSTRVKDGSWEEFLPQLLERDLTGKRIALYGLGDQEKYASSFVNALYELYAALVQAGAEIVGAWPASGYEFESSRAVVDGAFVGLVIDNLNQPLATDDRISAWLENVVPALQGNDCTVSAQVV